MVAFDVHSPVPTVSVGGPLPPPMGDKVHRITVDAQRNLPAMCTVEFLDDDGTVIDNPALRPGVPLTVETPPASEDPTTMSVGPLFDGEVVAVEAGFGDEGGVRVIVRGYDKGHRLHRTRKTRTFLMQPDNAVVAQIAGEYGLAPRVDPTPGVNEYLLQRNQTDWEFLAGRARELGFELLVSMGQLVFRKGGSDPLAGLPQRLERGQNLLTFRPRITSAEQPMTTTVKAWNPMLRMPVMGVAPPPVPENTPGDPSLLPSTVATTFGSSEEVVTDLPLDLQPAAMQHAMASREHAASASFEAEGSCVGNPAMVPGGQVTVMNVGLRFSGSYTLSTVRHVFDEGGYITSFTISGRHDRTLLGLARPGAAMKAADGGDGGRILAPVVGEVSNTTDPLQLGRVKVKLPWLGDAAESHWAPVVSVGAGSGKGLQVTPEVGDQVLVAFEQGDVRRPYVLGGLYSSQDLPPEPIGAVVGGQTNIRAFKTRVGHLVRLDDTPGMEAVTIETARGAKLALQDGPTPSIALADANGNEVTIDGVANTITVAAQVSVAIESAAGIDLTSQGQVNIEGLAGVNISGPAGVTVDGGAQVAVSGAIVRIN